MPSQADHQASIMAPVRWPPVLAVVHQRLEIGLDALIVQPFGRITMVVVGVHRIGADAVLVENSKVQRCGPPLGDRCTSGRVTAVHDRASPGDF